MLVEQYWSVLQNHLATLADLGLSEAKRLGDQMVRRAGKRVEGLALLDGLEAQTEQAMRNVLALLAEAGTGPEHVAKLTIYLAAGVDPWSVYAATRSVCGDRRTAVAVLAVTPARPGALVEIEAVATLPDR